MRIGLIGCGHIGGSLALALRGAGAATHIAGCDALSAAAERAKELGIVDAVAADEAEAVAGAELVILAVPVRSIAPACARVAHALASGAVVTDVGSVKARVVSECEALVGGHFVGGHPVAGTERSGPDAADAALFSGRRAIVTPTARTSLAALDRVKAMWAAAGAEVITMEPDVHDRVMAAVSQLPHVAAYALAAAVGPRDDLVGLSGSSFRDVTRVAATEPAMWVDIFMEGAPTLLPLVDAMLAKIGELRAALARADAVAIRRILDEGRTARGKIVGS